jgi:hypothetical protein
MAARAVRAVGGAGGARGGGGAASCCWRVMVARAGRVTQTAALRAVHVTDAPSHERRFELLAPLLGYLVDVVAAAAKHVPARVEKKTTITNRLNSFFLMLQAMTGHIICNSRRKTCRPT